MGFFVNKIFGRAVLTSILKVRAGFGIREPGFARRKAGFGFREALGESRSKRGGAPNPAANPECRMPNAAGLRSGFGVRKPGFARESGSRKMGFGRRVFEGALEFAASEEKGDKHRNRNGDHDEIRLHGRRMRVYSLSLPYGGGEITTTSSSRLSGSSPGVPPRARSFFAEAQMKNAIKMSIRRP